MTAKVKKAGSKRATDGLQAGWSVGHGAGADVLTADLLSKLPWLVHGFSTRPGGESVLGGVAGNERVLNVGFTDWDRPEAVVRNRRVLQKALAAEEMPLVALRQIHSDAARMVSEPPSEPLRGDALLTKRAGLLLAVQAADCVPILLLDTAKRAVAAVHAGWRGTLARIVSKTLGRMRAEFGTKPNDVVAALGPAIGGCCYEVGPEVAQAFAGQFAPAREWFEGQFDDLVAGETQPFLPWLTMTPPGHSPPPERLRLDLRAANRWQLLDAGVPAANIAVSGLCTACRTDLLFSYRREGPLTGRLMGVIGIREDCAKRAKAAPRRKSPSKPTGRKRR
jgi:YfiH family protein